MPLRPSLLRSIAAVAALSIASLPAVAQGGMNMAPAGANQPPASPRDSVKTTIADANIFVDYGRPSKRGRDVFGGLADMKWGMVWRTGANKATHFTTSKALQFGALAVPAGTYTLYTLLDEGGKWMLIVNKQTEQSGTEYDAKQDLVRIPLTVDQTPAVVEKMTIEVTPAGQGGQIALVWDRTRAHATFTVK